MFSFSRTQSAPIYLTFASLASLELNRPNYSWQVRSKLWYYVARELRGEDHYQYLRAYSAGLQEWVEALSFAHYLTYNTIIQFKDVENLLVFENRKAKRKMEKGEVEKVEDQNVADEEKPETAHDNEKPVLVEEFEKVEKSLEEISVEETKKPSDNTEVAEEESVMISVTVPQSEFILGLADLTGELMRNAINALGAGDMEVVFKLLEILQSMAEGFGRLPREGVPRDIGQKLHTLRQSCKVGIIFSLAWDYLDLYFRRWRAPATPSVFAARRSPRTTWLTSSAAAGPRRAGGGRSTSRVNQTISPTEC